MAMRFDPTINLTTVIACIGFAAAGFGAYGALDRRQAVQEEWRLAQVQVDRRQDESLAEQKRLNREDFKDINTKLDQLLIAVQRK